MKRREIAAELGISVEAVTNCRKRLNRKLEEMVKTAGGMAKWVVEDLKRR